MMDIKIEFNKRTKPHPLPKVACVFAPTAQTAQTELAPKKGAQYKWCTLSSGTARSGQLYCLRRRRTCQERASHVIYEQALGRHFGTIWRDGASLRSGLSEFGQLFRSLMQKRLT